jgi:regulatory protein
MSPRRARGPGAPASGAAAERTPADPRPDADPREVARAIALRQLTAAPRTRAQLDQALARRGVPDDVTGDLLDRLEEVGLVDDQEYARMWVESRHAGRGLSRRALRYELAQRGVDPDLVKTAVEVVDDDAELAAATALARRRLSAMREPDPQRRDRRLLALLARRGYGAGTAARALRAALAGAAVESLESSELVESIEISEPDDLE